MPVLRINRYGKVSTTNESETQCRSKGFQDYHYHICITCPDTNLDKQGFVIEHAEVHGAITKVFQDKIDSCEIMVKTMADAVEKVLAKHKVHVLDMYIKISPLKVNKVNGAYMEWSKTGTFI